MHVIGIKEFIFHVGPKPFIYCFLFDYFILRLHKMYKLYTIIGDDLTYLTYPQPTFQDGLMPEIHLLLTCLVSFYSVFSACSICQNYGE